jgi:hypothetical protein
MKVNRSRNGFCNSLGILRNHTRHHTGQNVARATGRHSRISGSVDPYFAIGLCDQRTMALQDHDDGVLARK